jgi:dTDP-glucose 4,6-dehydratase
MVSKQLWKNKMKVIITGGAGFIGGHAVQHFVEEGDDVLNIDKLTYASKIENTQISKFVNLDICETDKLCKIMKEFSPDVLINFAAETHVDNSINSSKEFVKSNLEGATSVMDSCVKNNVKLCHISTDEVYGPAFDRPFTESDILCPMNPYSATKAAADMMLPAYKNTHNLNYIVVRPSNNYGPNQHQEKFIPKLINCINKKTQFPLYGVGDQEREWTFVKDTTRIIRRLVNAKNIAWNEGSVYNLSSGITYKNIDVAKIVIDSYNKKHNCKLRLEDIIKFSVDRPGHDKKYWISSKKLSNVVNYNYTSFHSGVSEIV